MTRYAFLVGCEEYTNFKPISFCESDVQLIQQTLVDYCDYEYQNIERIYQYKNCDDNPALIYKKLQDMIDSADNGDSVLFYFAGHGAKEGEKGYLLLADSISSNLKNTALDLAEINKMLRNPKIEGFLILDACHSGIMARTAFDPYVANTIPDTGCITLASCSENEESNPYKEEEQGVFTYYLCEEIKKTDVGQYVYVEDLKIKVCVSVSKWAENNYKSQTPTLVGQIVGNKAIAFRNENSYERIIKLTTEEKFIKELKDLEEEFFNRCYLANLEFNWYDEYAVFDNYGIATDICWELEVSKYELVDDWQKVLNKLQFYMSRIQEDKKIDISSYEQQELLNQISTFVKSIPNEFVYDVMKKKELSATQAARNNMGDFLSRFASQTTAMIESVVNNTKEK